MQSHRDKPASAGTMNSPQQDPSSNICPETSHRPDAPSSHISPASKADYAKNAAKAFRRHRMNVTVACDLCKLKRVRCDGKLPCSTCVCKTLDCSYSQGYDRRQYRVSNDEAQYLSQRVDQYYRFVHILRTTSPDKATKVLRCLRSATEATRDLDSSDDTALIEALSYAEHLDPTPPLLSSCSPRVVTPAAEKICSSPSLANDFATSPTPERARQAEDYPLTTKPIDFVWSIAKKYSTASREMAAEPTEPPKHRDENEVSHQQATPEASATLPTTASTPAQAAATPTTIPWAAHGRTDSEQARAWLRQDLEGVARCMPPRLPACQAHRVRRGSVSFLVT